MKKLVLALSMIVLVFTGFIACKKSKSESNEPFLTVETTPANKSNNLNILGPDFPLKVEITSAIPDKGVKIVINAVPEGSSTAFFSSTTNTTAQQNDYTITNTPSGVTCVVTITVTSLTQASNTWTGSYRYSKK